MIVSKGIGGVGGFGLRKPEVEVGRTGTVDALEILVAVNIVHGVGEG